VPGDLDLRDGKARLRLAVTGGDEVDVLLDADGGALDEPDGKRPDALLRADADPPKPPRRCQPPFRRERAV
jgi:hypothetical protein